MSSPVASRFARLVYLATLAGCASTYPTKDGPPPRDFSVGGGGDLASGVGGNGGTGGSGGGAGGGGTGGGGGGGVVDMAAPSQLPDLAHARDLMPACLPSIADDGGVAPGLHLAAPGPGHSLYAARFDGHAWSEVSTTAGAQVADVALAVQGNPARPLILARTVTAELHATVYDSCYGLYPSLARIRSDAWTALRPSLAGNGMGADAVFRGGFDNKVYWSHFDGSAWSVIASDGNLTTEQIPAAVYLGGGVHAVYATPAKAIYDGTLQAAGGVATALAGTTNFAPAAVTTGSDAYVVFTGTNLHVYWFKSSAPATVHDLCDGQTSCFILAEDAPALSRGSDGSVVAVFRGTDHHLYSSSLPSGTAVWTAALPLTGASETTSLAVALAPGVGGDVAEAVYVRAGDGYPRHARLAAGAWQVSTVAAVALTGAAALAVSP